jgi:hypothetical protein
MWVYVRREGTPFDRVFHFKTRVWRGFEVLVRLNVPLWAVLPVRPRLNMDLWAGLSVLRRFNMPAWALLPVLRPLNMRLQTLRLLIVGRSLARRSALESVVISGAPS